MKIVCFLIVLLSSNISISQNNNFADPDSFLVGNKKLPKVLLVGSWHFNYPGLDAHQIKEENRINIFSEKRQKELQVLLDYISIFKPTKIAVEGGRNSGYIIRRYERWKSGESPLGASEIDQIAIRLMDRFKLDTLYGVDAYPLILELRDDKDSSLPNSYIDDILDKHYFGGEDEMSIKFSEFYNYSDKLKVENSLLENFLYLNSDKNLDRNFGSYISGGFFKEGDNYEGVDALSMFWMNRNLRIFRNIQNIDYTSDDRILVLFGAGHISILKFLFESSPEFELIDFTKLKDFN